MYQTTASVVKVNGNNIKEKAENGRRASENKITPTIRHFTKLKESNMKNVHLVERSHH